MAETYALAGETDKAITWTERGVAQREPFVLWLDQLPEFDGLREDPRFHEIVERVASARVPDRTVQ